MVSIITFSSIGLVSASQAISGAVARWNLDVLFLITGALVLVVTGWTAFQPGLRVFSEAVTGCDLVGTETPAPSDAM